MTSTRNASVAALLTLVAMAVALLVDMTEAFTPSSQHVQQQCAANSGALFAQADVSRRSLVMGTTGMVLSNLAFAAPVQAKPDCFTDCNNNCKKVVPNDTSNYCRDSCIEYCAQPDRRDGLSGSVSSEGGEVGILGGTFGQGTVVKGEDKPPIINLPGLNFNSKEGKKLIGL